MNEFRQALDAHASGQLGVAELERALTLGLTRQPTVGSRARCLHRSGVYRSGRLSGETYLALIQAVRAFQQSQSAPVPGAAQPHSQPVSDDKTQFRAPAQAAAPASGGDATHSARRAQPRLWMAVHVMQPVRAAVTSLGM